MLVLHLHDVWCTHVDEHKNMGIDFKEKMVHLSITIYMLDYSWCENCIYKQNKLLSIYMYCTYGHFYFLTFVCVL